MNIAQAIRDYHTNSVGRAWDDFWNYKCEVEAGGDSILSDNHTDET